MSHTLKREARSGGKAGLTLIEVLIATVVVAAGFAGILGTATHVTRMVRMARDETRATAAAQHALELVKTFSWIRLTMMDGTTDFDISGNTVFADLSRATCRITVASVTGETERLRRVTARVRWQRPNKQFAEREVSSLVARKKRLR